MLAEPGLHLLLKFVHAAQNQLDPNVSASHACLPVRLDLLGRRLAFCAVAVQRIDVISRCLGTGGESVWMQPPFFCDYGSNILLGERVFFNFNCIVLDVCMVKVGDFTLFGPAVQIYTATHPMNAEQRRKQEFAKPIEIGSDVWVGGGAIICPGVKIGAKSVIGAGSVVTRDIPAGVFAAGNPCRVIREITAYSLEAAKRGG